MRSGRQKTDSNLICDRCGTTPKGSNMIAWGNAPGMMANRRRIAAMVREFRPSAHLAHHGLMRGWVNVFLGLRPRL